MVPLLRLLGFLLCFEGWLVAYSGMGSNGVLLSLVNVGKRYDSPEGVAPLTVLEAVSLDVEQGESIAVIGPSGSGKSTLLQIIGTLDHPTTGEVLLEGQRVSGLNEAELAALRNRRIGFVFQAHYLLPQCSVLENVLVPTLARHKKGKADSAQSFTKESSDAGSIESPELRASRLLGRVGLANRLAHRPGQLSGGERQRVAVVRALINRPKLLLADEPTGALDHASAQELAQLLADLNREEQVTLIVVTHALDLAQRMGRVLELQDGRLVARRSPNPA